jgi:hypothetical protein
MAQENLRCVSKKELAARSKQVKKAEEYLKLKTAIEKCKDSS